MNAVDFASRHRDTLLLRRLLQAVISGGTMSEQTRRAILRGLTKAACTTDPDRDPSSHSPAVAITITNSGTINIFCERAIDPAVLQPAE